jgi:hypothetical protein
LVFRDSDSALIRQVNKPKIFYVLVTSAIH